MLPGADVVKIVSNAPNLLVYDIEASIPPKLRSLERLLPGVDVVKIIASSPHLLTFDIDGNIGPKIEQLWKLLPGGTLVQPLGPTCPALAEDLAPALLRPHDCWSAPFG